MVYSLISCEEEWRRSTYQVWWNRCTVFHSKIFGDESAQHPDFPRARSNRVFLLENNVYFIRKQWSCVRESLAHKIRSCCRPTPMSTFNVCHKSRYYLNELIETNPDY